MIGIGPDVNILEWEEGQKIDICIKTNVEGHACHTSILGQTAELY